MDLERLLRYSQIRGSVLRLYQFGFWIANVKERGVPLGVVDESEAWCVGSIYDHRRLAWVCILM